MKNDIKKIGLIYEDMDKLKLESCMSTRDGGSQHIVFSDGFKCMYDHGLNSPTKNNFVKSWKDRTIIELPEQYKEILKQSELFGYKDKI